jgi:maleate cis-trans isomerase
LTSPHLGVKAARAPACAKAAFATETLTLFTQAAYLDAGIQVQVRVISSNDAKPIYGRAGRLGAIIPANNSVLEPEWWTVMPPGAALFATRILAKGDLTAEAIRKMESNVDRAVDELTATGVDVIAYCDMVTTFIMEAAWNENKVREIEQRSGTPAVSAWTAMRDALAALRIRRLAIGTPYPRTIHAMVRPFFEKQGFAVVADATLDIVKMREVPTVDSERLEKFVVQIDCSNADALVLLATDLPTFNNIAHTEKQIARPVLTSNQTLLWRSLRAGKNTARLPDLGKLFDA